MPSAWEILKGNSTLDSGRAWDHLNNQEGGEIVYTDRYATEKELEFTMEPATLGFDLVSANAVFILAPADVSFTLVPADITFETVAVKEFETEPAEFEFKTGC